MDWTFRGASTRNLTHCYHDYPARMIPQVAGRLLDTYGDDAKLLFDPYCGTGTCLVEGLVRGINGIGTDLNPLARLIARAKTCTPHLRSVDAEIDRFVEWKEVRPQAESASLSKIDGIPQVEFWFKPKVTRDLNGIKAFIDTIANGPVRLFFQVAFSETVRACSNSRIGEFKLYRYDAAKLERFHPDAANEMSTRLVRNRDGLEDFHKVVSRRRPRPHASIRDFDTIKGIPRQAVEPTSVDIVVTSPPYGDSHTTVAYGQYSRLSAAWLGLRDPESVDRRLMGGTGRKVRSVFHCDELERAIEQIEQRDPKRACEVSAFYGDLYDSISHVAAVIRPGGHACYVVGNRKVKGVVLPTDVAVCSFFRAFGFNHVDTFHRSIPNKRMPLRNSPTNVSGAREETISSERIVVMRKAE